METGTGATASPSLCPEENGQRQSRKTEEGSVSKVLDLKVMSMTNWLLIGFPGIVTETSDCGKSHLLLALNKSLT